MAGLPVCAVTQLILSIFSDTPALIGPLRSDEAMLLVSDMKFMVASFVLLFGFVAITVAYTTHVETYLQHRYVTYYRANQRYNTHCTGWWFGYHCRDYYYYDYSLEYTYESYVAYRCQTGWKWYPACNIPICNPDCPSGFSCIPNNTCQAENCRNGSSGCEQNCYNANDSYACSCNAGFRLASNGKSCDDIDECVARLDNCTVLQNLTCENTKGSYRCVHARGFKQVGKSERRGESPHLKDQPVGMSETTVRQIIFITVGVVVGVGLIISIVVCVVVHARKRKRNTEGEIDLKNGQTTELTYQELSAVTELENTYEAIRKPKKSIDVLDKEAAYAMQ